MLYVPEFTGSFIQIFLIVLVGLGPVFALNEAVGFLSLGYSKFAQQEQKYSVPSRVGMFIIYFPAVLLFPAMLWRHGVEWTPWHITVTVLMSLHFAKRCFETLFVHRYSGVMNGWTVVTICFLYSALSAVLGEFAATEVTPELAASDAFSTWMVPGIVLWALGQFINGYHHVLLARLRKPGETGYKLPKGGLFGQVACPHYLGEILAWLGYALVFHHAAALGGTWTMSLYLAGRSHNTVKWYRERVEGVRCPFND